jgi:hypothetical protein
MSKGHPISIRAENHMRFASLTPGSSTDASNLQDPGKAEDIADSKKDAENDRHCRAKRVNQHDEALSRENGESSRHAAITNT